ncbi:MAG: signal peptidase [Solirubrobacterales bacterium]|jgi:signal peptidase I|nr:signal peptidase [Solirubrobacterales bacterium]
MSTGEKKSPGGQLLELVGILVVAIGLAVAIQAFLVKPFQIPSASMVPTLEVGQRVLVNRLGERFGDPSVGDVIVFHPPAGATDDQVGEGPSSMCGAPSADGEACAEPTSRESEQNFIKRIVAGPGDTIAVVDSHVIRNGERQDEPFIQATCETGTDQDFPKPIRVPAGHWFVMGDNRQCSQDSRYWGPVAEDSIIGGAFATYWPPKRLGPL